MLACNGIFHFTSSTSLLLPLFASSPSLQRHICPPKRGPMILITLVRLFEAIATALSESAREPRQRRARRPSRRSRRKTEDERRGADLRSNERASEQAPALRSTRSRREGRWRSERDLRPHAPEPGTRLPKKGAMRRELSRTSAPSWDATSVRSKRSKES